MNDRNLKICIKYSDFFEIDGLTNSEFFFKKGFVMGSFTINGERKIFVVNRIENHTDELYRLLMRSIRKDKLKRIGNV